MARIRIGDLPEAQVLSRDHDIPVEMGGVTERTSAGLLLSLLSGDAPEALDTLEKIAAALGGDPNFSETITAALGQKAALNQVVRHDAAQSLTPTQKKQACSNIGALVSSVAAKSADYTVVAADAGALISVDASAANRTIALPSLASVGDGFPVEIKKSDTSFKTVTIAGTVDGITNKVLRLPGQSVTLVSDNTSGTWRVLAEAGTVFFGGNVDGDYIRRADGTQECWGRKSIDFASATGSAAVGLPIEFAAAEGGSPLYNALTGLLRDGDTSTTSNFEHHTGNYSTTNFTLYARNNGGSGAQTRVFNWRLIGRWF